MLIEILSQSVCFAIGSEVWRKTYGRALYRLLLCSFCMLAIWPYFLSPSVSAAGFDDKNPKPEPGKARNILTLIQEKTDTGILVRIIGDGKLDMVESRSLYDPPRLVMDFPGVLFPEGPDVYTCSSDAIKKIRINKSNPDKTRLVFDLTGITGTAHHINPQGAVLNVEFITGKEDDTRPVAKITEPQENITVRSGRKLPFSGSVTGGNEPLLCEWTFAGNGMRFTTHKPEAFIFDQPGTYEITYHVTDKDGDTATDSITVTVNDASGTNVPYEASPRNPVIEQNDGNFGMRLGTGIYHAGSVDEFIIERREETGNENWSLSSKDRYMLILGTSYRFTPWLDLNADLSCVSGDSDANFVFVSAGPRIMLPVTAGLKPYLRTALTYGHLDWGDAPGDFDYALGWVFGYGIAWSAANWDLGIDLSFHNMSFDYTGPATGDVSESRDQIDFSGYALSLTYSHLF